MKQAAQEENYAASCSSSVWAGAPRGRRRRRPPRQGAVIDEAQRRHPGERAGDDRSDPRGDCARPELGVPVCNFPVSNSPQGFSEGEK